MKVRNSVSLSSSFRCLVSLWPCSVFALSRRYPLCASQAPVKEALVVSALEYAATLGLGEFGKESISEFTGATSDMVVVCVFFLSFFDPPNFV